MTEYQFAEAKRISAEVGLPLHKGMHRLACLLSEINIPFVVTPSTLKERCATAHTYISVISWAYGSTQDILLAFDSKGELIAGVKESHYIDTEKKACVPVTLTEPILGVEGTPAFMIKYTDRIPCAAEIIYFA